MVSSFISDFWYEDKKDFRKVWFKVDEKIERSCKYEDGSYWFCCRIDFKVMKLVLEVEPEYEFFYKWVNSVPCIISVKYIDYNNET